MSAQEDKHEASELPLEERIDYLMVVAAMMAADGDADTNEVQKLRELCEALKLAPADTVSVIAQANEPDITRVQRALTRLKTSALKFTLMTDCLFMAFADGKIVPEEEAEISAIADALGITQKQVIALRKYVEAVLNIAKGEVPKEAAKRVLGEALAGAASVGAPIGAIALSGSVYGLSAAGITSGLAALGMGAGMLTGLGAAIGLGVGTYVGVKWLYGKVTT